MGDDIWLRGKLRTRGPNANFREYLCSDVQKINWQRWKNDVSKAVCFVREGIRPGSRTRQGRARLSQLVHTCYTQNKRSKSIARLLKTILTTHGSVEKVGTHYYSKIIACVKCTLGQYKIAQWLLVLIAHPRVTRELEHS